MDSVLLWVELCPPKIHVMESSTPVPYDVTVCGDWVIADVINSVKVELSGSMVILYSNMTGVLIEECL